MFSEISKHLKLLFHATLCGLLFSLTFVSLSAVAQTSKGTLAGTVRDLSGAVIANATVTAVQTDTKETRKTVSSALGAYRFDALTPGEYVLQFESTGFEKLEAKNIDVRPSQAVSYDATLKPGHVDETVSVSATNLILNQENASLASTVDTEQMEKLPIFSLNPIEVLTTIPGVQVVSNSDMSNGQTIQVSGARPRANNYMIDGQEINDATIAGQAFQPNIPDMYTDTVIYTHNAPAEFGRASGGVVNLITKGGTNSLHGGIWELYSGSGLNATDGQTRQLTPKDRSNKARWDQHQFGFTVGGPIIKNKLFAFGAAQWTRYYGNELASPLRLPDADGVALLQSLAGGSGTTATQAALLLNYLSNASYLTSFSEYNAADYGATNSLGDACPADNAECSLSTNLFVRPATPASSPDTQWTYRVDYKPTSKDTFSVRYLHDRQSLSPDFYTNGTALPGFDTQQGGPSEIGQGAWTHVFNDKLVNEFRAAETRISFSFAPTAESLANSLYTAPEIDTAGAIATLGFNQSFPQGRGQDMYQFQDTISWTRGRHTIRAGADIGRRIEMDLNSLNLHGNLAFADGGSGSTALGNFLLNQLGPSGAATLQFGSPRVDPHSWRSGIFAQDDVKILPNLTVNLGIRWDYFTNPDNSLPYPAIDPSSADTLYGPINTVHKVAKNLHDFAPRVGFAYTPRSSRWYANSKTVIRGGFGIFYDSEFTNITVNTASYAPNIASGTLTSTADNGLGDAMQLISQIGKTVDDSSSVFSVTNNLATPYTEEWNLGIDRELPWQTAISASYVGSHGVKLFANQQYNYFDYDTGDRLNPSRGPISARGNFAASKYNGLEVGLRHNMNHGLTVNASYVYSKTQDNGSEIFSTDSAPTSYSADLAPGGRKYDWGNSAYDHRQYLAFTYVWSPAGLHSRNEKVDPILSAITRHWTISGSSRFQTGAYATPNIYGVDTNGDGSYSNDRPLIGNKRAPIDTVGIDGIFPYSWGFDWFEPGTYYDMQVINNTLDAVEVTPDQVHWLIPYGKIPASQEIGRNSYLTPGSMFNDIALEKAVPTSLLHLDRGSLVFRTEIENFANHNNLNFPTASYNDNYQNLDLLNVGMTSFLNRSEARENNNRSIRFWMKFTF